MKNFFSNRSYVKSVFLSVFVLLYFSSCKNSKSQVNDNLLKKIENNNNLGVELVFECEDPLVAVDSDKEGNFYLVSYNGNVFKVLEDGTSKEIYSGLGCCGFSLTSLTVLPDGDLILNDCEDNKDILIKINQKGEKSELAKFEHSVLSLTSDKSGKIFAGIWVSEGNLTVNFDPNHLSAAEYIAGKILEVNKDGSLKEIYEGGLPMCIRSDNGGNLFATLWGEKGAFSPEPKSYSVADLRHIFWIALSEECKIISLSEGKQLNTGNLQSISSFEFFNNGSLIVQAIPEGGKAGLYLLRGESEPINLKFIQEETDNGITGLKVSKGVLYFINVDGKFYKVK
jgi:hypothetical protein